MNIVLGNAHVFEHVGIDRRTVRYNRIIVLFTRNIRLRLSVDPHFGVFDKNRIAGQSDRPFDIVFALVDRTDDDPLVHQHLAAAPVAVTTLVLPQSVIIAVRRISQTYRISFRKVEYDRIVAFYVSESFQSVVRPLDPFDERLFGLRKRHRIVHQRHRNRRIRDARTVGRLADAEIVADQHTLFHRRRRNHVHLEDEDPDQRSHDRREQNRFDPLGSLAVGLVGSLAFLVLPPEQAVHRLRYINIVNHDQSQQQPQVARPDHEPQQVNDRYHAEFYPAVTPNRFQFVQKFIHSRPVNRFPLDPSW